LQGLAKSTKPIQIYVIAPNEKSLIVAKNRFKEVSKPTNSKISYLQNIRGIPKNIDLAIIATTANVRREVIESLLDKCSMKYLILEKVVFQKSVDFKPIQNLLFEKNVKTWVNCTRRSFLFYKKLKKELGTDKLSIKVEGNNWGLASNSIHMIDLLAFLSEKNNFIFDTDGLENILISSKRNGFSELKGTLKIQTSRGDTLELKEKGKYDKNTKISISNDKMHFNIYETQNRVVKYILDKEAYADHIRIPFQSELTGSAIDQILDTGESDLTSYDECMKYHLPMLDALNTHISKVTGQTVTICPIT
jgi:hypothetical protein